MAKTKSTYNKKRSMRRSTRKAGMFGFSSAPKSWEGLAKIKLKEIGKPEAAADAGAVAAMAQSLFADSMLKSAEYDAKYPGHQSWTKPMKVGGKRRRSKKSTRKRGRKGGLSFMGRDFGDVRGSMGKFAAKSGLVDENVFTKDRGMARGAANVYQVGKIGLGVMNDMALGKKIGKYGGKRRRSKRSTKKAGNMSEMADLTTAYLENRYDDAKKLFGSKTEGGKRRRSRKSTKKRSRKH